MPSRIGIIQSILLITVAWLLPACSVKPMGSVSGPARSIVRMHGGVSCDPGHTEHADALLEDMCNRLGSDLSIRPRMTVLGTDDPVAFASGRRDVYVSEGLLRLASDDEVRAAIAHELGHLLEADQGSTVMALADANRPACPEARADRLGRRLLDQAGYDTEAMHGLLQRLMAHPSIDNHVREQLSVRAGLLEAQRG